MQFVQVHHAFLLRVVEKNLGSTGELCFSSDNVSDSCMDYTFENDNHWHLIQINTHKLTGWDESNLIKKIKIKPVKNTSENDSILIDYIKLKRNTDNQVSPLVRWHLDGSLVKSLDNSKKAVYLIENKKKRLIPSEQVFEKCNFDWTNILRISDEELGRYPDGEAVGSVPFRFIKRQNDSNGKKYPYCFLVTETNRKQWVVNETIKDALGLDLSDLEVLSKSEIDAIHTGPSITTIYPEGTLIKEIGNDKLYIISNGEAKFIEELHCSHLGFSKIDTDNDGLMDSFIEVKTLFDKVTSSVDNNIYKNPENIFLQLDLINPKGGDLFSGNSFSNISVSYSTPTIVPSLKRSLRNEANMLKAIIVYTTDKFESIHVVNENLNVAPGDHTLNYKWKLPNIDTDKASVEVSIYDEFGRPHSVKTSSYFSIESSSDADNIQKDSFFTIYNDGGEGLRIDHITPSSNSFVKISENILTPFTIPALSSKRIDFTIDKSNLSIGEHTSIIQIESNDPNTPQEQVEIVVNVKSHNLPPEKPSDLIISPNYWTNMDSYTISWTNPNHPVNINGGYYKVGGNPDSNYDGQFFSSHEYLAINAFSNGEYEVCLWLQDELDNIDYNNYQCISYYHDSTLPDIQLLSPPESDSNIPVDTSIVIDTRDSFSGIDIASIILKVNNTAVSPQIINVSDLNVRLEFQNDSLFNFDEDIPVEVEVTDKANNLSSQTFVIHTFSGNLDADNDGLINSEEYVYHTDPFMRDSDNDILDDNWEILNGTDPLDNDNQNGAYGDIDNDGLTNLQEYFDGKYYSASSAQFQTQVPEIIESSSISLTVNGEGVVAYKYLIDSTKWSEEESVKNPIMISEMIEGTYELSIIGKDSNGNWQAESQAMSISWIVDLNYPPTCEELIIHINEDSSIHNIVPVVVDPDSNDTHIFTIISQPENGIAEIVNNQISYTPGENYFGSDTFIFSVTDQKGLSVTEQAFINVSPINDPPTIQPDSFSIAENSEDKYVAYSVIASDLDNDSLSYQIISGNSANVFSITTDSGQIFVENNSNLNFEYLSSFDLTVVVSDGQYSQTALISISVEDINESPVALDQSYTVNENSEIGTIVGKFEASDEDSSNILSYSITEGNVNNAFIIDSIGNIIVNKNNELDFETKQAYTLTVTVSDSFLTTNARAVVNLVDVNDTPIISNISDQSIHEDTSLQIDFLVSDAESSKLSVFVLMKIPH